MIPDVRRNLSKQRHLRIRFVEEESFIVWVWLSIGARRFELRRSDLVVFGLSRVYM